MRARNKKEKISFTACYSGIALSIALCALNWSIGLGFLLLSLACGVLGYIDYKRNAGYNRFLYMPYFKLDPVTGKYFPIVLYDEKLRKEVPAVGRFLRSVQFTNPDAAVREAAAVAIELNKTRLANGEPRITALH